MSGVATKDELDDLLGPEPDADADATSAEVLVDETPKPKSRPMGADARGVLERSRSYPVNKMAKKNTPERLKRLLDYVAEMPVATDACRRTTISLSTLKYWLQKSKEGMVGDGFDIELGIDDEVDDNGGMAVRFHDAWDAAMEIGVGRVEEAMIRRAGGYEEVQVYKGRVQYKIDPDKYDLAVFMGDPIDERNPNLWLRDQYGVPVPETVWKMDPDLAMFIAKTRKPQVYGAKATLDVNVKGGVLVVGMKLDKPEDLNEIEGQYRREGTPPVLFDDSEDNE